MATYSTITNRVVAPPVAAGTFTFNSGTCSPLNYNAISYESTVPLPVTRTYEPIQIRKWRVDPTKNDRRNWSAIKRSGSISMTALSVGEEKTEQFVVGTPREEPWHPWNTAKCATGTQFQVRDHGERLSTWTENTDIRALSSSIWLPQTSLDSKSFQEQISDAIASTQSAAFANSLSSYDVLTELAEGRQTLSYLRGKVEEAANVLRKFADEDPSTHRKARNLTAKSLIRSSDKALRRAGSRWMEIRYAIMPLIYSIKDVNELLGSRNAVYKTDRSRETVRMSLDRPSSGVTGKRVAFNTASYEAVISSTVKSAYNRGALQRVLALSSFNPFKTGWELIPYSFVVDWFVNVGDVITSQTSIDLSSQKVCCTSVKKTMTTTAWLHDSTERDVNLSYPPSSYSGSSTVYSKHYSRYVEAPLQIVSTKTYDRFLWSKPEPVLTINPYLNWKRYIDASVLSYQPIRKLLRSL